MPWQNYGSPDTKERIVAGLCYLSSGLIGLIYIIVTGSRSQSDFFRFHFLQSMLITIMGILLNWTVTATTQIVGGLGASMGFGAQMESGLGIFLFGFGWLMKIGSVLLLYGLVMALMGKFAEIPVLSRLVRQNMRGY